MKRKFTFLMAALLLMFSYAGLAQVVSGTTYSTPSETGLPEGWSGADGGGTTYMKLIAPTHYIQTAGFEQEGFTSITLKARKYGGPSEAQAKITVSWYDSQNEETVLGTIDPTNTTLTNYTINTPTAENGTGYIKIQCKGAPETAGKGSGVSEVTITYTEPGGTTPTTYTVTYNANVTGVAPVVDTYTEGANVTLRPSTTFTYDGHLFSEWNTQADGDGDAYDAGDVIENIQDNIVLYAIWTEIPADEQWVLTNLADLTANDVFVIVGNDYAMTNNYGTTSAPATVAVTINDNEITSAVTANIQWTVGGDATNGYTFSPNGSTNTYLYCNTNAASGSNNNMRVGTGGDYNRIYFELNSNNYLLTKDEYVVRYLSIYNNADWRGYINTNLCPALSFYKKVTGGVVPPSISAANVDIEYNATAGSIAYTINDGVEGGTMSAAVTEGDWLTLGTGTTSPISFTCSANGAGIARTATVTLTYTYNRATVTANVTVTQAGDPNATMTIAEVRAQGTGSVVTTGIVTSCVGTTGYIQDATAAICVYGAELTVGDEIRVSGTLSTYKGLLEITSPVVTVLSNSNTVEPTLKTIAEINADDITSPNSIQGLYVTIENATVTNVSGSGSSQNTTIAQGTNNIVVHGALGVTVAINNIVTLNGNIGCYNVAQIANPQNVQVQVSPAASITVTPTTVEVPVLGAEGTLTVTYQNITEVLAEVYFCDAEGEAAIYDWIVADIDGNNNLEYIVDANDGNARTAYLKVYALDDNAEGVYSNLVTFTQPEFVAPTFAELPFSFDEGRAAIDTINGLYQEGLGTDYNNSPKLKFDGTGDWVLLQFAEQPGTLTFNLKGNGSPWSGTFTLQTSEDGVNFTDLRTYDNLTGTVLPEEISDLDENVRYIKWVYTEKVSGNVALGNINLAAFIGIVPSITVDPEMVEVAAEGGEGTLTVTYENLEELIADVEFCDAEGGAATYDWITASLNAENNVEYLVEDNEGEARTAYLKVYAMDGEEFVYSNLVTISQAAYVPPFTGTTYTLATFIESGRSYIITNGSDKAMGAQSVSYNGGQGNNRTAVEITTVGNVAQVSSDDVYEFVINGPDANGFYTIYDASDATTGYLYAASSSGNQLKTRKFNTDANSQWTITFDEEENNAVITAQGNNTRNLMRYNSGSDIFSCYSGGQQPVYLFVKDEEEPTYAFYTDVHGCGEGNANWYLIASPVDNLDPETTNMINADGYDLFAFDQSAVGAEWQNYKTNSFNLAAGQGYLYANVADTTLKIEGTPGTEGAFGLAYDADCDFPGWNLVGNPFGYAVNVNKENFYVMNEEGTNIVLAERTAVNPLEGIFVKANGANETVEFLGTLGQNATPTGDKLSLSVSDGNGNSDFARIRFSEGRNFDKFMLHANNTKLYFPMEDADYAVVYADNMGEMPVNFEAAADGNYTLTIDAGNMEMEYLHLIDHMTGADVDLLANPSYSFNASVNDNAARFTLVFAALTERH